jgi:hypothetical protein
MVGGVETPCHTRLPSLNYAGSSVQPSVITHSLTIYILYLSASNQASRGFAGRHAAIYLSVVSTMPTRRRGCPKKEEVTRKRKGKKNQRRTAWCPPPHGLTCRKWWSPIHSARAPHSAPLGHIHNMTGMHAPCTQMPHAHSCDSPLTHTPTGRCALSQLLASRRNQQLWLSIIWLPRKSLAIGCSGQK